jgi:polyhydroxyalkanoate synthesis regulator phasin
VDEPRSSQEGGLPDALRTAVERTLQATADSAAGGRERTAEMLDEVAKRGQEAREGIARRGQGARDAVARRGQDAREASAAIAARIVDAIGEMRLARGEDVSALSDRVAALERRLETIERGLRNDPNSKVEN